MTVVNDERWHAFNLDPEQREAFEKALSKAGFKVHRTLNRVPYDKKDNAIDGPKVREILRAIKAGGVPSPASPAPKKKWMIKEDLGGVPEKREAKATKKKAPAKKAKKGGA